MDSTDREALGVDIGGVIIARRAGGGDTAFDREDALDPPEVDGAVDTIRQLVDGRFGRRVYLVSKCGPRNRAKTLRWLKRHRFFERTGIKPKHVRFCMERSEKAPICRELGITHFVDDRLDVLVSLTTVPYRYLLDVPGAGARGYTVPRSIMRVTGWDDIARALLTPSQRGARTS